MKSMDIFKRVALFWVLSLAALYANPKAMIIFDASGSMWGQIDGINKIVIARDALRDVVRSWNPKVDLGLTVYGHRIKGDCNDIQTVIPVGPVNKKRMIDTVMRIQPKGMTPIAKSLQIVAEKFRRSEEPATIILISDGRESCEQDPCVVARSLKAQGINFVAHVVGFNVDRATDRQLACIAKATGGEYFSAKNAAALNRAIKVIAKKVEKSKPKPKVPTKTSVKIEAHYKTLGPRSLAVAGMHWRIEQNGKALYEGEDGSPTFEAKPGTIHIRMSYDRGTKPQKLEGDARLKAQNNNFLVVYIESGTALIDVREIDGGPEVKSSVHIYPAAGNAIEEGKEFSRCVTEPGNPCVRTLPVGGYLLTATYRGMKISKKFTIGNGEKVPIHLVFRPTGWAEFSASEAEGGPWIDGYARLFTQKTDKYVGNVDTEKDEAGRKRLPVGKYVAIFHYNRYEKKIPFEIKAGERTKVHAVMGQTGWAEFSASEAEGGPWIDGYARLFTQKTDKHVGNVDTEKDEAGRKRLPVGKYVAVFHYNQFEKKVSFQIKAGETTKVHAVMGQTGWVEFSASESRGGPWIKTYAKVYDQKRDKRVDSVDMTKEKAGRTRLPVGKYYAISRYDNLKKEIPFEIKAGETTKIHIIFGQMRIRARCADSKERVEYAIYAKSGRRVAHKKMRCSKPWKVGLDDGSYILEAKSGSIKKRIGFETAKSRSLEVDLTQNETVPKNTVIQSGGEAAAPTSATVDAEKSRRKSEMPKVPKIDDEMKKMQQAMEMIRQMGQMMGAMQQGGKPAASTVKSGKNPKESSVEKEADEIQLINE